ncbi:alkaline phosphatase [Legionella birminghamensis]|uniref:Alkaline phosphatase n=1 Tax=Legionella birminghamensis TaxID=28083 RepID=A0A378ICB0_9GAMM|nr:alkaline phosphatase family protein [Legionella birminghamensis]KTC74326.1 alkaline phosphatase [Legionella birminghamensis]STX32556.1 alkaline phosphatase [Legionella birminghamensis]
MKKYLGIPLMLLAGIASAETAPPKLVVQIVVDQLRGDLLERYKTKFAADGFNYLYSHGISYQNAHHPHAHTVTCVGHATIATGSYPALHGVVANDWIDRKTGQAVYCMEDSDSKIIPTAHTKKELPGRSPRQLLASTLSDELVLAQKGHAFAVSLKDRAAITLAGHSGQAYWFDRKNGGFVSSSYYLSQYPQWVTNWNADYHAQNETWSLSRPMNQYAYAKAAGFPNRSVDFGNSFPHHTGEPGTEEYFEYLSMTPKADELTADFAIHLLKEEKLGQTANNVDYLGISFSAVDAVGHEFGPNSLESEDNLLRLDQTMAKLLKAIDAQVGLANTLIVLSADHGVSDSPSYLAEHNMPQAKALNETDLRHAIEQVLLKRFQLPPNSLQAIMLPYVYLNHEAIAARNLDIDQVSASLAEALNNFPGVFQAYALSLANTQHDWLSEKVVRMANLNRAGDIYLVPPPYQLSEDQEGQKVDHGTPWQYDSYVPILFVNGQFTGQKVNRPVYTTDIASTLAAVLAIKSPSAAVGQPLAEVMRFYDSQA